MVKVGTSVQFTLKLESSVLAAIDAQAARLSVDAPSRTTRQSLIAYILKRYVNEEIPSELQQIGDEESKGK